ncbi:C4-dicarboxylate transporter DcuC [Terrisporobacter sp.]|uniref:C4-dicarboxylate transporter DcuC n=1 Tax=Terrisporobacter sp. TaxID=1965305 RepID=UPI00262A0803|nr:C4-dicarboxylate transporter DcuC [Terrisporobacter sp.]
MGASTKLAQLATKPLSKIKNPYVVLSLVFILGCMLKLVITSHSGLSMLLVATTLPILLSLGISKLSAAVVMIFAGFCDWGPNDSSAIFAAENVSGMPIMEYFMSYQGRVAGILILILAIFLPIYLSKIDKKLAENQQNISKENLKSEDSNCPAFFALLPIVPLVLITVFSFIDTIQMDVITSNVIGLAIAFLLEMIRRKDRKAVCDDFNVVLKAMGTCFANIVSILIGAAVFAEAIKLLGGITIVSNLLASVASSPIITMTLMSLITFGAGMLLGSGNASWYAFGPLVPDVAAQMGVPATTISLPMQLSSGVGRCVSPVAGAIIAVAGMVDVDQMDLIKACSVPAALTFVMNMLISYLIVMM